MIQGLFVNGKLHRGPQITILFIISQEITKLIQRSNRRLVEIFM